PSLTNVTIMGAGISCLYDSSPSLINCIVIRGGNGMYVESGNPSISYSNFWNNNANFNGCDPLIGVNVTTNANGDSCDVYYNIQLDPLFFDPDNEDFHLTAYSPCIDAGTPDTTGLHLPEFDLDGNPRIYNGIYDPVEVPKIIDMGVYEEWRQYGSLEGYVTELDGGAPIEGAEITFVQYTGFTNGDGYYIIDSLLISELVGSYTFTCHKNGYADTLSEGVEILFNYTTTCNFEMTTSTMVIDPLSINEIIAPGEVLTTYITISNNGNAPLNYSISVVQDTKQKYGEGVNRSRYTGKTPVTEKNFKPENRITKGSAKIEFSASPEYLSRKSCNNSAVIGSNVSGWYSAANKSGYTNGRLDEWYTYGDMNAPWQLTWATPERVTYFNPADFGLCYSFDITRISHWFYEHPDYPWDDATFHFKIYADDGVTLLYESEDIEAQHMVEIIHELTTPVTITSGGFYFGVAPVSSSGFPSTCGDNLYTGTNHSYYGSPGNWALWSGPPDMGEFIQGVYLTYHPWMTVEPMSGTVEPGCVDMVAVTFYATGVEAGTIKTADIVITSFDPDVGYVTIP
ncbi:MAG: carboxypeptidase regulatory-like domain-containing protein, partial [Candidatus Cloacimonetes bacterium]|nr:carboxypeptidase regulatory-like domain-containing protein [Candidatus Cloacimonadota bacterium]